MCSNYTIEFLEQATFETTYEIDLGSGPSASDATADNTTDAATQDESSDDTAQAPLELEDLVITWP